MADWVLAAERAYVAKATGGSAPTTASAPTPPAPDSAEAAEALARARAAAGAVASRYLAIGTPRSFGLVVDESSLADGALSLTAHRTWFQPQDIRCAGPGAEELARQLGGRVTSTAEALACDIVCVHAPLTLEASALRRGTHVNLLAPAQLDDELPQLATIVPEDPGLAELAAGLVDGRQLDEITIFVL